MVKACSICPSQDGKRRFFGVFSKKHERCSDLAVVVVAPSRAFLVVWEKYVRIIEMKIEKIVPGGQGLGTLPDGKKVFLWNCLPGEEVTDFLVTKKKAKYLEGVATKIEDPAENRVEPRDLCFLSTSPWQIFDYQFELRQKAEIVREVFRQNGIFIEAPEVVTDGREWNCRNKMEYALFWDKETEKIKLAFHERGSHRKVPIEKSSIERSEIYEAAEKIVFELNERHEEARKYQSLLLRTSQDGTVSGGLYENRKAHPLFPVLQDEILGISYHYSPNGFFQINLPVYELALEEIRREIQDGQKVLDLYSGVGTIGLSVARGGELTLVECNKEAFSELEKNAQLVEGAKAVLAKSEEALEYIEPEMTVILDPPRAGCERKLLEKLLEVGPKKIVYLSCNPATQARDVAILNEKYIMGRIKSFNFFPKTPHIENLVVLEKSPEE